MKMFNLFVLSLLLIVTKCQSQTKSLITVNQNNLWQYSNDAFGSSQAGTSIVKFSNDSILIGGKYYKNLLTRQANSTNWSNIGKFREEKSKVFQLVEDKEYNIFDFNMAIGDSIWNGNLFSVLKVKSMSDTITLDGQIRKVLVLDKFCFNQLSGQIIWIEGIGNVTDGHFPFSNECIIIDPSPYFDCFSQNNEVVYSVRDCLNSSIEETNNHKNNITVLPNPTTEDIDISWTKEMTGKVIILNSYGQGIYEIPFKHSKTVKADLSQLEAGIYFFSIISKDQFPATGKIVKI